MIERRGGSEALQGLFQGHIIYFLRFPIILKGYYHPHPIPKVLCDILELREDFQGLMQTSHINLIFHI